MRDFELLLADEEIAFASFRNLLIQVRRGELTLDRFRRITTAVSGKRVEFRGVGGYVGVLEEGAPVVRGDVRAEQSVFFKRFSSDPRHFFGVVVEGDGVLVHLQRTIMRGLLLANPQARVGSSVREIAPFLAAKVGCASGEVVDAIAETRRLIVSEGASLHPPPR